MVPSARGYFVGETQTQIYTYIYIYIYMHTYIYAYIIALVSTNILFQCPNNGITLIGMRYPITILKMKWPSEQYFVVLHGAWHLSTTRNQNMIKVQVTLICINGVRFSQFSKFIEGFFIKFKTECMFANTSCRQRFPRHRSRWLVIPVCTTARALRTCRDASRDR